MTTRIATEQVKSKVSNRYRVEVDMTKFVENRGKNQNLARFENQSTGLDKVSQQEKEQALLIGKSLKSKMQLDVSKETAINPKSMISKEKGQNFNRGR